MTCPRNSSRFSTLQRAEIAEMIDAARWNELADGFSTLQRAEIAEIERRHAGEPQITEFQYSSTSRNC